MKYFAYGSNMLHRRLLERCPSAVNPTLAYLPKYKLFFDNSFEGAHSGACGVSLSEDNKDVVYGVLYDLNSSEKPALDKVEDVGKDYIDKEVTVYAVSSKKAIKALVYVSLSRNTNLLPFKWYKEIVLEGAKENRLPNDYISFLESFSAKEDTDCERSKKHYDLIRSGKLD